MSGLVLDCSVAVAWCFEDEAAASTDALLDRVRDQGAMVPAIWPLEVANVLVQATRRGRLSAAGTAARLAEMAALPITVADRPSIGATGDIVALALAEGLTSYDAAYLSLAIRHGLPLATKDKSLAAAARRSGIATLPG